MNIGYGLLVAGNNPDHIQSMADLCGLSFGAVIGTIPADQAKAQSQKCVAAGKKAITIVPFPSNGPMVVGVESGRIQATVNDYPTMVYVAQQSGGKLKVVGQPFDVSPYGIAVPKSDPQLAQALKTALQDGINSQAIQKAIASYGVTSELPTKVVINGGS